jgi:hypothetical protein
MELRKELLQYATELRLVRSGPLSDLKPLIGIDGESFIASLLEDDFLSQVLGGSNFTLRTHLSYHIQNLKERGILPVFFFSGVSFRPEQALISKKVARTSRLWEEITKTSDAEIEKLLIKQQVTGLENMREVYSLLRSEECEVMKTPAHCGFQLAHMAKLLRGVGGGLDLCVFGIDKVVVGFDYESASYQYVLASELYRALDVGPAKLLDCLVARGFWNEVKYSKLAPVELLQALQKKEIAELVEPRHVEAIRAVHALVDSRFYLARDEDCKLHCKAESALRTLMPERNAEHLYFALCLLPLSSELITAFVRRLEVVEPPVADSLKYRTLVHRYRPHMARVYSVLARLLDNGPGLRPVKVQYWYDPQALQLELSPVSELNWDWLVSQLGPQADTASFPLCLAAHLKAWKENPGLDEMLVGKPVPTQSSSIDSLRFLCMFRLLEVLGFVTPAGKPTLMGKVLSLCKAEFQSELLLVMELIKLGLLDWKPMNTIYLPEAVLKKIEPDTSDYICFISRVCALVQPSLSSDIWKSGLDHDLAQFYSIVRYIAKVSQYIGEVYILEEFVMERLEVNKETVSKAIGLSYMLPLKNVAVGMLVKKLLQGRTVAELKKEFPQATDVEGDLEKAWIFWKEVQKVVKTLTAGEDAVRGIINESSKLFKTALITAGIHVV